MNRRSPPRPTSGQSPANRGARAPQRPVPPPERSAEQHSANGSSDDPPAGALLLPLVPDSLDVHPMLLSLLHLAAFLDLSDDDAVHPAAAGAALERMGLYIQRLDDETIEAIADDLDLLIDHAEEAKWPPDALEFVSVFLESCGFALEEDEGDEDDAEDEGDEDDAEVEGDEDDAEPVEGEAPNGVGVEPSSPVTPDSDPTAAKKKPPR